MTEFKIDLDDKPALSHLLKTDKEKFRTIVGTFVGIMEVAAQNNWTELSDAIHSSISFKDVVTGVLEAVMDIEKIDPKAYTALESDLHPLSLLSDNRKNFITGEHEAYDWKAHFVVEENEVTKDTITRIIRKILYLVRWFDIESVSKAMITQQFPVVDAHDIKKLPFQPSLQYQQEHLGELYVGKFLHEIGAFNCGEIEVDNSDSCLACNVGTLQTVKEKYKVCPRCNAGFKIKENEVF